MPYDFRTNTPKASDQQLQLLAAGWMAPTSGDVTNCDHGENANAAVTGTVTHTNGLKYHAAPSGVGMAVFNGTGNIEFPDWGGPCQDISKPFYVCGAFSTSSTAYQGLFGNGAEIATRKGFRLRKTTTATANRFVLDISDGAVKKSANFDHVADFPIGSTDDDLVSFVLQCKYDTAANKVIARCVFGQYGRFNSSNKSEVELTGIDMSFGGTPERPGLVVGDWTPGSGNRWTGKIVLGCGELPNNEFFSEEILYMLGRQSSPRNRFGLVTVTEPLCRRSSRTLKKQTTIRKSKRS